MSKRQCKRCTKYEDNTHIILCMLSATTCSGAGPHAVSSPEASTKGALHACSRTAVHTTATQRCNFFTFGFSQWWHRIETINKFINKAFHLSLPLSLLQKHTKKIINNNNIYRNVSLWIFFKASPLVLTSACCFPLLSDFQKQWLLKISSKSIMLLCVLNSFFILSIFNSWSPSSSMFVSCLCSM